MGVSYFFLYEFAAPPDLTASLILDTDQNPQTGCLPFLGAEVLLRVFQVPGQFPPELQFVDWLSGPCGFSLLPGAKFAMGRDNIEFSIPVSVLRTLTPNLNGFLVWGSTGLGGDPGDPRPDFLLPPVQYIPARPFSSSCPAPQALQAELLNESELEESQYQPPPQPPNQE